MKSIANYLQLQLHPNPKASPRDGSPPVQPPTLLSKNSRSSRCVRLLFVPFISSVFAILVRTHETCRPFLELGAGRDLCLGEKREGGIGSMVPDGVLDAGPKRKLTVVAKFWL
eukprot:3401136-Rhodomonas_salina.1